MTIENIPYTSYEQKITAEFITGGAPDLFWVNTPWLGTFIKDGMLTNLAPLIKANHINMAQYYPQLVALHSRGSAIYGLPKDWDTIALYYNKAYFAKLHLAVPANLSWNANGHRVVRDLPQGGDHRHQRAQCALTAVQPGQGRDLRARRRQ